MPEASPAAPTGERKFAVALFADLSGYTALCRRLDPEEVELTVAPQMASLRAAVESTGGTIVNVAGDGFFALYGVPRAQADAADRAVSACRDMLGLVASHNAQPGRTPIPDVHIGVASGEVLITPSDEALGWSVVGNAVNLASRLCSAAGASEALFDASSHALLGESAQWKGERQLDVKGHDTTVTAWELETQAPTSVGEPPSAAFVGRRGELSALDRFASAVVSTNASQVVAIGGEAGIGKTRLLREWLEQGHSRQLWVAPSSVADTSLMDVLSALADATANDEATAVMRQLTSDSAAGAREDPYPLLAATARRLAAELAQGDFAVVVIDDLRASNLSLVTFLEQLARDPIDAPLLVVCTFRHDEDAPLPTDIHLGRLDAVSVGELLAGSLGAPPDPETAARLLQRVQGHPLLAVQTAAYLREARIVEVNDGVLQVRDPTAVEGLPTSIRMFIAARIDQLAATEKEVLQQLSCLGSDWSAQSALGVIGAGSATVMSRLKTRALLETDAAGRWKFAHGLVQQVAYASITRRNRAAIHQRLHTMLAGSEPAVRAYHAVAWYESSPSTDLSTVGPAAQAALIASLDLATSEFKTDAQAARAVVGRVRSLLEDHADLLPEVAAQLWALDGQCLIELNRFDDALLSATRAVELGESATVEGTVRVRCMLTLAHAMSRLRRYQGARQVLDNATALAERIGDGSGKAHAIRLMADTWRHSLFGRYISLTEEAHREFERCGDVAGAAECARILAYLFTPSAPELYSRWAAIARAGTPTEDLRANAWIARSEAMARAFVYEIEDGNARAVEAIALAERCGAKDTLHQMLGLHLQLLNVLGRPQEARAVGERLITLARRERNPRLQVIASALAATALARTGDLSRALEELQAAQARVSEFGPAEASDVATSAGAISGDRGCWTEALSSFAAATAAAASSDYVLLILAARMEEARVRLLAREKVSPGEMRELQAECETVGAPVLGSFFQALADAAEVAAGRPVHLGSPITGALLEERATRADTAALRLELLGEDAVAAWSQARDLWQQLGYTISLARAQARCGDVASAEETLALLDSPAEARAWALGR